MAHKLNYALLSCKSIPFYYCQRPHACHVIVHIFHNKTWLPHASPGSKAVGPCLNLLEAGLGATCHCKKLTARLLSTALVLMQGEEVFIRRCFYKHTCTLPATSHQFLPHTKLFIHLFTCRALSVLTCSALSCTV